MIFNIKGFSTFDVLNPFFYFKIMSNNNSAPGKFAHIVYFWLKNPNSENDKKAFEASLIKFISNSVFIKTRHLGIPASTNREVIDSTYSYNLSLTFENKELQDKYQVEKGHVQFIEESSKLWEKVIVYDSENILNP